MAFPFYNSVFLTWVVFLLQGVPFNIEQKYSFSIVNANILWTFTTNTINLQNILFWRRVWKVLMIICCSNFSSRIVPKTEPIISTTLLAPMFPPYELANRAVKGFILAVWLQYGNKEQERNIWMNIKQIKLCNMVYKIEHLLKTWSNS